MDLSRFKNNKIMYLVIVLAAGILMIMLSGLPPDEKSEQEAVVKNQWDTDTGSIETRLAEIVETVDGVHNVSVFLSYENTGKRIVAFCTDQTRSSDGQKQTTGQKTEVITEKSSSGEKPFVTEEIFPQVRGVIISAEGVGREEIRLAIADAVSSALGVPVHRVKVLSKD